MGSALKTERPHIVKVADVLGGEPAITGTRVGVAFIARLLQAGEEPSAIVAAYPHLAPAAVYDAISYYLDHREKVDAFITDSTLEALGQRYGFEIAVDGKVGSQSPTRTLIQSSHVRHHWTPLEFSPHR